MVLVTGGTGFLGAYILKELLAKGYQVRALRRGDNLPLFIGKDVIDKVNWVQGDILDVVSLDDAMQGIDTVIHSAAVVSFDPSEKKRMYRVNVEGTANVVNAALENDVNRLVHISSVAALGRVQGGDWVDENHKWNENAPHTHYAKSKKLAELELWRGIAEGLSAVIVNPSTILGYGDWNASSARIFRSVYQEFPWYTNGINGFVDVEDVARATVLLMESNISGERFIINGDNWSFRQLFDTIAERFGVRKPHRLATPFLGGVAWRIQKLKSLFGSKPLLTKESARIAQSSTRFSNKKLLETFADFRFRSLSETVEHASRKYSEMLQENKMEK